MVEHQVQDGNYVVKLTEQGAGSGRCDDNNLYFPR